MGMFDTVHVHESLIHPLVDSYGFELEITKYGDYFNFQTKDLDNALTNFFIEKDESFCWEKLHQEYIAPTEEDRKKKGFHFGEFKELAPPEKIEDTRTAYIEFYDFFIFQEERIFITFLAHVKNGKLIEPISIKSIERTNLQEEAARNKINQEKWDKVRATWQWKVASAIHECRWKIKRFFLPIFRKLDNLESDLRKTARNKFLDENDIGNW